MEQLSLGDSSSVERYQHIGTSELNPHLLILLGDMEQPTGAANLSQQFVRAVRHHVPPSALTVLSLDEAVGWYWGDYPKEAFRPESRRVRLDRNVRFALRTMQEGLAKRSCFIFSFGAAYSPFCLVIKCLVGSDYAVYAHDLRDWNLGSNLVRKGLKGASWIIANSRDTQQRVLEYIPRAPERVPILPPAVDGHCFRPNDKRQDLIERYALKGHQVLLCVGRLALAELDGKGYPALIRALPEVLCQMPKVKLLMVGSGDGQGQLCDLAVNLGVQDHMVFAGRVPDEQMCDHYNLCDVFVLPSVQEGFGMVYTEALACGKPVIGGAARGALDALLDGRLGLLVDPDDVPGLADAIIRMLQGNVDPHLLDPTYLRETVQANYGFERFTERVGELLEMVLGERQA